MKFFIIVVLLGLLGAFYALSTGMYNVAATEKHWGSTENLIKWARENSIKAHSKDLEVPPMDSEDMLTNGAVHYAAMCTECHLAPGKKETEMAQGIYPKATVFHEVEPVKDEAEKLARSKKYFWAMKHGIKMTAMPAWGPTHDDESLWAMTAFVMKLNEMSADEYEMYASSSDGHHHDHGGHDHGGHDDHGHGGDEGHDDHGQSDDSHDGHDDHEGHAH